MLYKTTPACSPEVEAIVTRTIGCALRVHQALGPGYAENIYQDAMGIDLMLEGLRHEREVTIQLTYRGQPLRPHRLDLVVEKVLVVELKAVERLAKVHESQILWICLLRVPFAFFASSWLPYCPAVTAA